MASDRPEVYFLHIPKTAGTSLASLIRNAYPQEQGIPAYQWQQLVRLSRQQINSYRCYHGHFGTGLYSLLDRPVPTVTMLRDPFERTVSHQFHSERLAFSQYGAVSFLIRRIRLLWESSRNPRVHAWIERSFVDVLLRDFQTRSLGVDVDLNPRLGKYSWLDYAHLLTEAEQGLHMDEILERAKRRLDGMAVVGTVERFGESVGLICDYLGIPAPQTPLVLNVAPRRSLRVSYRESGVLSPKLAALFDRITAYDRQLYEYGCRLLDARLKSRTPDLNQ